MSFEEIELIWKVFNDNFDISKNPIDEKKCGALLHVSDERYLFFNFRYDDSDFGLRVHIKSFEEFLDKHSQNFNLFVLNFILASAVKNVLEFPNEHDEMIDITNNPKLQCQLSRKSLKTGETIASTILFSSQCAPKIMSSTRFELVPY